MSWYAPLGLNAEPFSKELSDTQLWLPRSKQTLVDDLIATLTGRQNVLLTGDPGVGKTCVLRALRGRLPQAGFRLTYCHNATLGRRDFYRQLCLALGLSPAASAAGLFYAVSTHVEELGRDRIHPVLLLDEAHLLHQDTLDHLHILLNYEMDSRALLSLVLIGLPELSDRLAMRRNRSLYSRLHRRLHLDPLTPDDTAQYIRARLEAAGATRELLTRDAIAMLHEATAGAMRDLDRLATLAIRAAAHQGHKLIERELISHILGADEPHPAFGAAP